MNTFNNITNRKLEKLFSLLPEVFFWTVILSRCFIAVPLFLAAKIHFSFLHYPGLIVVSSLVSVLVVELVLTLPSLGTAFFKQQGLKRYQKVAFITTLILGAFNQSLIVLAWQDIQMSIEALYIYSVLNIASIILSEFIGYMVTDSSVSKDQVKIQQSESMAEPIEYILNLELDFIDKIHKLSEVGCSQRKIASLLDTNAGKVNRVLKRQKEDKELV